MSHFWFGYFWPKLEQSIPGVLINTFCFMLLGGTFIFRLEQHIAKQGNKTLIKGENIVKRLLKKLIGK